MISVAVIAQADAVRQRLRRWVESAKEYRFVRGCRTGESARRELPHLRPDVVLLDDDLGGHGGVLCVRGLRQLLPESAVIVLSARKDHDRISEMLRAGVSGYLLKQAGREEILGAIEEVLAGGAPMTREIARRVFEIFRGRPRRRPLGSSMSDRETEVLDLLSNGLSNKQIASNLGISYETVGVHLRRVYEKLGVRSRTEASIKHLRSQASTGRSGAA